ncbi:STP1 protein [Plasmodium ovale curtisi]|uniref:STP1 protein n=1 Tax=Plasmodium ovale curtisi TaxID=864141 RepID=A0A1A8X0R5_PLAOA|nr:STP1 protein [Plasmodium ovale curtisi]
MADHSGYTTLTKYIPVEFFIDLIKDDIKKLIHTYGHKNCGLRQEELCNKIKEIIPEKKKIILKYMDTPSKNKWSIDWDSERSKHFDKLYKDEGFINMCFPKKYTKKNPSLDQLLSKHIKFCKEKDVRRLALEKKNEYSVCRQYNSWIDTERKSFTREYLKNAKVFRSQNVNKYFSTKEHPEGHDPLKTYLNSKLDCNLYNPPPRNHPKGPVEKAPTISVHSPAAPDVTQRSKEKNGKSLPDVDSKSDKTKTDEKIPLTSKPSTTAPRIPSLTKTEPDGAANGERTNVKAKGPVTPIKGDVEKKKATPIQGEPPTDTLQTTRDQAHQKVKIPPLSSKDTSPTPATESVTAQTATASLFSTPTTVINTTSSQTPVTSPSLTITSDSSSNSGSPSPSDPLLPAVVTKDQVRTPHPATPVTSENTYSTQILPAPSDAVPSLAQAQTPTMNTPPAVTSAQGPTTPASSSSSTVTTTVTTTSTAPTLVTISTMSTTVEPISSVKEATSSSSSQEPPPPPAAAGPEATASATDRDPQKTVILAPMSLGGSDTAIISVQTKPGRDPGTISAAAVLPKPKGSIQAEDNPLSNDTQQTPRNPSRTHVTIPDNNVKKTSHQIDQQNNTSAVQHPPNIGVIFSPSDKSGYTVKNVKVNTKTAPTDDSKVRTNKNDNPSIIPEDIPPLTHIIPTLLLILGTLTLLFQLYKYTPLGLLLGRRRKRRKRNLRRIFEVPEEPTYESPNITVHEWKDHNLGGKTVENNAYIKLFKINRYKQEMQKSKKKNKTTLIELHMEVLEENKMDEWELHKSDFLEICLRGFINEENDFYSNLTNSELTINNIKNEKTIEDIQKHEILWNNWIENHRNILEQWKEKEWFHILKNKWRNEQQKYKEKNDKLQENILNEQETHSIVSQKDIWKRWISKQATLIDTFNKEDWFNSIVCVQDKEKDNYPINEYNNISVTSTTGLKNEKMNHEHGRSKNIIQKLMVQIHMMVLEECIKEDIIKHKELCIDNFIEDIYNQNNYDEKKYIPQCDTDDFDVPEYEEIHTSINK